ncbi:23S rRNA (adenine(2030)-N(6))-methyltransferase RlmJ [Marinospirillum sp.]|uniref:23S rRNA (adenine(2030)-N(6))-methyltransferase RlmJ n=1 Tax=Marinospirillum sp. TaxID=2183934 RepID=UPI00384C6BB8
MLSYRHSFHAGNFADLLKHITLVYLLDYLNKKDKPYCYLDTHSGAGLYDLTSSHAAKTNEFSEGIARFAQASLEQPQLQRYWQLIKKINSGTQLRLYPGSPQLASLLLRPTDRLLLNELHSTDHKHLVALLSQDKRCLIKQEDAFAVLKASLPPKEKRGLVFIDPSYEKKDDYQKLIQALVSAHKRFATGVYAIWYPVISRQDTEAWIQKLVATGLPKLMRIEHCPYPDTSGQGMTGSGMLIINPPYTLAEDFKKLLKELEFILRQGTPGKIRAESLS